MGARGTILASVRMSYEDCAGEDDDSSIALPTRGTAGWCHDISMFSEHGHKYSVVACLHC